MDDCLTIVRGLLAGTVVDHDGEVVSVHDARITPAPPVPVPIVVGGRSDAALRRAARLGDGWLGVFVTPERWDASRARVEASARELGRTDVSWEHGLSVWVGFGESRDEAAPRLATAMESLYHRPFREFSAYVPHGTPDDVATQLEPYVDAGCRTFNVIPVAVDDETAIDGCARVRSALRR
jgi:alkanesulfonate monooxygenase SsuD/methylene tetrahydromethanopterin reductase-like flavin-dependent oxidoreductase (luciferase family)